MIRTENGVWTTKRGEVSETASMMKNMIKSFFGFACLPPENADPKWRGRGLKENQLCLSHLSDVKMVEEFIRSFKFARGNNAFNGGTLTFIAFVKSLLKEGTGYIYQKPEIAREIDLPEQLSAWRERCLETWGRLSELQKIINKAKSSGSQSFKLGRDPKKRIQFILDAPHPTLIVMKMVEEMFEDVRKIAHAPVEQAKLYRDALLLKMVQANPLRLKMYAMMNFDEHLVKEKNGSWWIQFERSDFKNGRFLKSDYRVRVAEPLWEVIDDYKNIYRPRLKGSEYSSQVFWFKAAIRLKTRSPRKRAAASISNMVVRRTRQYLKGSEGFRIHSFRHILATDIIKNYLGDGFYLAATVLNDDIKTVRDYYAHLKTSDFFEPYNRFYSDNLNLLKSLAAEQSMNNLLDENIFREI